MVAFNVVHSVTIEMCTGFLTLASFGILVKFLSDIYMKLFFGKIKPFDRIATVTSRYAEPASYFGLGAGIFMTFVSMGTGTLSWSIERLMNSQLAHNKMLLTIGSQVIYLSIFWLRKTHTYQIWLNRTTTWLYVGMTMVAFTLLILQNSVAGHMVGKGSLIDDLMPWLVEMEATMFVFPVWGSILMIVLIVVTVILIVLYYRRFTRLKEVAPATE